jgi:hypothetical protein
MVVTEAIVSSYPTGSRKHFRNPSILGQASVTLPPHRASVVVARFAFPASG